MSLTTPSKIRELQIKLYRKAKNEPGYRFYMLYDKVYREEVLAHAYALARANKGASGVDEQTFEEIESAGLAEWLTVSVRPSAGLWQWRDRLPVPRSPGRRCEFGQFLKAHRSQAKPGRTVPRYLRTGMSSRRQVSNTDRMAATFGPACGLPM